MRKSIINQREITENGTIQIRVAKQIVDAGEVVASSWHRCALEPGQSVTDLISAVDADLTRQGYGAVVDWSSVQSLVTSEHTSVVIKAYQDAQAAAKIARDAERGI
jgi:hypothetical protein